MSDLSNFDGWLADDGPAAVVIREPLMPVEGPDGVLFPATFAATEDKTFAGGYNIDEFPDGRNVCLVDSVGSQANRIEPIFAKERYADLVPQVVITAGDKQINLLEAGHRAGDAIVRCSELNSELQVAFKEVLKGNAEKLAKIAPTSLVFGVWDSRGTQAKLPRLVASTIKAYDVRELTRSANYLVQQQLDYVEAGLLPEPQSKPEKEELSKKGFLNALASRSHGGVVATGGVRREATLSLAALRLLAARESGGTLATDRTQALRRYILGLCLTALTAPQSAYLRQGCNLVPDPDRPREFTLVHGDGRREGLTLSHADALSYAKAAAKAFGVGPNHTKPFDKALALKDVTGESDNVTGTVTESDAQAKTFKVKPKKGKATDVTTSETTTYHAKDGTDSTFEAIVKSKANVAVELAGGVAVKVTAK